MKSTVFDLQKWKFYILNHFIFHRTLGLNIVSISLFLSLIFHIFLDFITLVTIFNLLGELFYIYFSEKIYNKIIILKVFPE